METANSKTAPKNPKDTEDETPPTEDEYENDRYEQAEEKLAQAQGRAGENWRPKVVGIAALYRGVIRLITGEYASAPAFLTTSVSQLSRTLQRDRWPVAQCWLALAEGLNGDDTKALARLDAIEEQHRFKTNPLQKTLFEAVRVRVQGGTPVIPDAEAARSFDLRWLREVTG